MQKSARVEALQTWLCPGCCDPKPQVKAVDVWLQNRRPPDKPLNAVFGCGVGVIHRELLDVIGPDIVERDLYLGRIIDDRGNEVQDWATYRGRRGVIIRGDKEAANRVCDQCGQNCYFAMGKSYLYPAPPTDATIYESRQYGLVVPPEVFQRVSAKKWRRLGTRKLPVLDEPLDGFGTLAFNPGE
jgi:hypothetical protein